MRACACTRVWVICSGFATVSRGDFHAFALVPDLEYEGKKAARPIPIPRLSLIYKQNMMATPKLVSMVSINVNEIDVSCAIEQSVERHRTDSF